MGTSINKLLQIKGVESTLKAAQKQCAISLNSNFLKMNMDLLVTFWDWSEGTLKVRLRSQADEEDEYDEDAEDEQGFIARVLELLAGYQPPTDKRQSVLNRAIPEAFWVPAKAILGSREKARLEECASRHSSCFEKASTETDGVILRMLRHPRAADGDARLRAGVLELEKALGPDAREGEAERRLRSDEKFSQMLNHFPLLEHGSEQDATAARSLRARVHIIVDAHRLADTVLTPWDEVQLAIEKNKWYRQLLGRRLSASDHGVDDTGATTELQECLDAMAKAWPDLSQVVPSNQGKKRGAEGPASGRQAKKARGKGKGKGKGRW